MEHYEIKPDIEKRLCQSLRFVGYYDAHIKYEIGDIVLIDGAEWIWTEPGKFERLGYCSGLEENKPDKATSTNCCNCGAPLFNGNHSCVYCGTYNK